MLRFALQTCLTVMALTISASASVAAECADDPNECMLKKQYEAKLLRDGVCDKCLATLVIRQ